jgi:hypothetical protein
MAESMQIQALYLLKGQPQFFCLLFFPGQFDMEIKGPLHAYWGHQVDVLRRNAYFNKEKV